MSGCSDVVMVFFFKSYLEVEAELEVSKPDSGGSGSIMDSKEGGLDVDVESIGAELGGLGGAFKGHLHLCKH